METEKKAVIEILLEFENKANKMIMLLAENYELDLTEKNPFEKFLSIENNIKKGPLDEDWTYWFHGSHCDFENVKTKQYLHVSIISGKNYGAIDYFFTATYFL